MKIFPKYGWLLALALVVLPWNFVRAQATNPNVVTNAPLIAARWAHSATLLPNGLVLIAGGQIFNDMTNGFFQATNSVELYDPQTGMTRLTAPMIDAHFSHTATLLRNGQVLIVGGRNDNGNIVSGCELYDPVLETWTQTDSLKKERTSHSATLLPNGNVLVVAGYSNSGDLASAEIYDVASGTWSVTAPLGYVTDSQTATVLTNGLVLVAGGSDGGGGGVTNVETFNPNTLTWTTNAALNEQRAGHTATLLPNGQVLVAGGGNDSHAELYDPEHGTWTPTPNMNVERLGHTATLLTDGTVMVAGGYGPQGDIEIYDPIRNVWNDAGNLNVPRGAHEATMLPNGSVVFTGGDGGYYNGPALDSVETFAVTNESSFSTVGNLQEASDLVSLSLLPDGTVLAVGGIKSIASNARVTNAQIFNFSTATWTNTASPLVKHAGVPAVLLPNGKVLVADTTCELYDSVTKTWALTGSINPPQKVFTATLLNNGMVLAAAGEDTDFNLVNHAWVYDPSAQAWSQVSQLNDARYEHTATLLTNGQVLVAGGLDDNGQTADCEIYDPVMDSWTETGMLNSTAHHYHTATLLQNGKVLVTGGYDDDNNSTIADAELYDPTTQLWTNTGPLNFSRYMHTATLLSSGKVLVEGGDDGSGTALEAPEVYDPASGLWTMIHLASQVTPREGHAAILSADGRSVLLVGGADSSFLQANVLSSTEKIFLGPTFSNVWQPQITSVSGIPDDTNFIISVSGSGFLGVSEGSGGNGVQSSPGNNPLLQLQPVNGGQTVFLPLTNWTATSLVSIPVPAFPDGYALATVFVNGIPSNSRTLLFSSDTVTVVTSGPTETTLIVLTNLTLTTGGGLQFSFAHTPGSTNRVFATGDLTQPFSSWALLGTATETTSGQFQFTDTSARVTNRFYRVKSP